MFQERTKKLFNLKKTEKNEQKHLQSLSKDLSSEENFKKFKSQKSYHTNTESQAHQKLPTTVINGPNDNNIISINLNILQKEKKTSINNKSRMTDIKLTTSKKIFKNALSPNYPMNSKISKKKTNYIKNKVKEKNTDNKETKENINESINNNKMNSSMNSSLNKRNLNSINCINNNINSIMSNNSGIRRILNDKSIQELDTEENEIINICGKNKNNISNTSNSNDNNKISIKDKTSNNINNINVNINYNNSNSPKNKKNIKINESSFSISNIININDTKNNLNIELLIYSKKGYKEKVLEIIGQKSVDINYQNENGWTALHYACDEGNLKIVEILIKAHCDINIKNNDKKIPLHYSVTRGYFDITKLLVDNGGDLNCLDNENNNLIHICSMYGYDELLTFLLNKNSELIYHKNIFGNMPIQLAKKKETKIILEKFMKNNPPPLTNRNKSKNEIKNNNTSNTNYLNSNDSISKIKIHKTNHKQIKALMIPINKFNQKIGANLVNISDKKDNITQVSNQKVENIMKINNNKINNSSNNKLINSKQYFSPTPSGNKNSISNSNTKYKNIMHSANSINLFHYNTSSKNPNTSKKQFNIKPNNIYNSPLKTKISKEALNKNKLTNTNYISKPHNTIIKIEKNKLNNKNMSNSNAKKMNNKSKSKLEINKRNLVNNVTNYKNNINKVNINHSQNTNLSINNYQKKKSKTSYNNKKNNSRFIKKNSKKNIDITDSTLNNNTKNENTQEDTHHYMPSHRTISLPGFIDINSKNKVNENNQSRNNISKNKTTNSKTNIKNSVIQKKELKMKTKSDLNRENDNKNNNKKNSKNNFNKNLSEYKIGNNNINKSANVFKNENKNAKEEKDKIFTEKITFRVGQIYTDEEENNLIEDLDEEINDKNNNKDNILINDNENENENEYEYGNSVIIKKEITEEKEQKKETDFKNDKIKESLDNKKNNKKYYNINNVASYKNQINSTDLDNLNDIHINEFYLKDQIQTPKVNDKQKKEYHDNNKINDIENNYFNNIDEMSDSYSSEEEDNNNPNSVKKVGPSNFICLALLGQGSFGEVYLVQEKNTQNYFAMKVLDKKRIEKQNIFKYAMTERNVLSIINFPFIVKLNYAFQTKDKLFLLLDYCPGGDLSKQLQIQTRFSEDKAKFYICEITLALGELHKKDIIFRDLKPDNIVIDKEGHVMLTDFGLSREGVNEKYIAKSFCGSIAYLAPEMLNRKGHGKAVDWYLLGVCFYEMLVGIPPYFSNNKEQIFKNIEKAELFIPNFVSRKAQQFLRDLLKKDPENRLGSKRDVEEIKEHPYMEGVDWERVYKREYMPPPIIQKYHYLNFFDQPKIFIDRNDINKNQENYNQIVFNDKGNNIYEGWSFVQNTNNDNSIKDKRE